MQDIDDWITAGKIASEVREFGLKQIKAGVSLYEITCMIESKIRDMEALCAFPPQLSPNSTAAHYYAESNDIIINKDDIIKLDLGIHVNGAIADTASSVCPSQKHSKLIDASRNALNHAIDIIKPGLRIGEIGRVIEQEIKELGYNPIKNLSGHGLGLFRIHCTPTIPNFDNNDQTELKEGDIFAIEPFATPGFGSVSEKGDPDIFSLVDYKPVRNPISSTVLKSIRTKYDTLPFARKWINENFGYAKGRYAINDLMNTGIIRGYPPLVEIQEGMVSQAEHSVYVDEKSAIVLTK
jgi:methionyl aminopeptidase